MPVAQQCVAAAAQQCRPRAHRSRRGSRTAANAMPPHQQGLLQLGPQPCAHDLLSSAWIALALLGLRWVCDRTVVPALARALAKHGRGDKAMHAFDDMYIVVWAVGTEAVAVYLTVADNGGCTPLSTEPCWTGFPHAMSLAQRWWVWGVGGGRRGSAQGARTGGTRTNGPCRSRRALPAGPACARMRGCSRTHAYTRAHAHAPRHPCTHAVRTRAPRHPCAPPGTCWPCSRGTCTSWWGG